MNWYKKAQWGSGGLRGEWWFRDGRADFADQDIGDDGHASMAIDSARHEIADYYYGLLKEHSKELSQIGLDETGSSPSSSRYRGDDADHIRESYKNLIDHASEHGSDVDDRILNELVAKYGSECIDAALREDANAARMWGLKQGWIRVQGNNLEIWQLNNRALSNIVHGLWEAYGEQLSNETKFNIEIVPSRQTYFGIPLEVLESQDVGAIRAYKD